MTGTNRTSFGFAPAAIHNATEVCRSSWNLRPSSPVAATAGCHHSRRKPASLSGAPFGPGKDERVSPGRDVGVEMGAEFLNDAPGKRDRTPRPPRLGRAEGKFAVNVREGLSDRDTAPEHVNPLAPKPSQFAEAQATVNRQENQDAKAGFDGVGKG